MNRLEERWQIRADCLWRRDITPTGNRKRWVWSQRERECVREKKKETERKTESERETQRERKKKRDRKNREKPYVKCRVDKFRGAWEEQVERKNKSWSQQGPKPRCQLGSCEVELTQREQPIQPSNAVFVHLKQCSAACRGRVGLGWLWRRERGFTRKTKTKKKPNNSGAINADVTW